MDLDKAVDHLQALEFDEDEATIYLLLLRNGPSRAGDIVSLTEASRGKVYDALKELCRRGVATKTPERPAIYQARPPEDLFELASREAERQRAYVELLREELLDPLKAVEAETPVSPDPEWELLDARSTIFENLLGEIDDAERSIECLTTHEICGQSLRPVQVTWGKLGERARDGVEVRVLSRPDPDILAFTDAFRGLEAFEIRPLEISRTLHYVVIDREIVFYWIIASEQQGLHKRDDVAVRTDAHGLVAGALLLHETLWSSAEEGFGDAIQEGSAALAVESE